VSVRVQLLALALLAVLGIGCHAPADVVDAGHPEAGERGPQRATYGAAPACTASNPYWCQTKWVFDPESTVGTCSDLASGLDDQHALCSWSTMIARWGTSSPTIGGVTFRFLSLPVGYQPPISPTYSSPSYVDSSVGGWINLFLGQRPDLIVQENGLSVLGAKVANFSGWVDVTDGGGAIANISIGASLRGANLTGDIDSGGPCPLDGAPCPIHVYSGGGGTTVDLAGDVDASCPTDGAACSVHVYQAPPFKITGDVDASCPNDGGNCVAQVVNVSIGSLPPSVVGPAPSCLSSQQWLLPCTSGGTLACSTTGTSSTANTCVGDSATTYYVTLRFRGVVEPKIYTGGTYDGVTPGFNVDGTPDGTGANIYKLVVSSPSHTYYLNAVPSTWVYSACSVYAIDYTKTIPVNGGASVTLTALSIDSSECRNNAATGGPLSVSGITTPAQPYDGQFMQVDVVTGGAPIAGGGPGTAHAYVIDEGTSLKDVGPCASGQPPVGNGTSSDPSCGSVAASYVLGIQGVPVSDAGAPSGYVLTADAGGSGTAAWAALPSGSGLPDPVTVAHGGTGDTTLPEGGVLVGDTANAVRTVTPYDAGIPLVSAAPGNPVFGPVDLAYSAAVKNVLPAANQAAQSFSCTGSGLTVSGTTASCSVSGTATLASITDGDVLANISGSTAAPIANTLSALLDHDLSSTQGSVLYRGASGWNALGPGTSGQILETLGPGANPQWIGGSIGSGLGSLIKVAPTVGGGDTTTSTGYTTTLSPNSGPALTVTTGTSAVAIYCGVLQNSGNGNNTFMSLAVSGATSIAGGQNSIQFTTPNASTPVTTGCQIYYFNGTLTAGSNTFSTAYAVTAGTGTFYRRTLMVVLL